MQEMNEPQGERRSTEPADAAGATGGSSAEDASTSEQARAAGRAAGEQAERIADDAARDAGAAGEESPDGVRERVRRLVVETLEQRSLSLDELNEVSRQVLEGAAAGVRDATPEHQRTVLRSVIDGLGDSYATAANATRLAIEEANARSKAFADEDLREAARELRSLSDRFVRTVLRTTERAGGVLREEAGALRDHAQRAAEAARPSIEEALGAATRQPGKLAGEAASAGVEASRHTAGRLLRAVAGLLQGAGDALTGASERDAKHRQQRRESEQKASEHKGADQHEGEAKSTES